MQSEYRSWALISFLVMLVTQAVNYGVTGSVEQLPFASTDWLVNLSYVGAVIGIPLVMATTAQLLHVEKKLMLGLLLFGLALWASLYDLIYEKTSLSVSHLVIILLPLSLYSFLQWVMSYGKNKKNFDTIKWLILIFLSLAMGTDAGLNVSGWIYPETFDQKMLKVDRVIGLRAEEMVKFFELTHPAIKAFILNIYNLLTFFMFFAVAKTISDGNAIKFNVIRVLVVPFGIAFVMYALLPVCGPSYAFNGDYPFYMKEGTEWLSQRSYLVPYPRNGMPSMHLTGALLIFAISMSFKQAIYQWLAALNVIVVGVATISLGEHYYIDLIVALPFSALLILFLIDPLREQRDRQAKKIWAIASLVMMVAWYGIFYTTADLAPYGWALKVLAVVTVVYGIALHAYLNFRIKNLAAVAPAMSPPSDHKTSKIADSRMFRYVKIAFFISGFAGLLYEVVYAKNLAVIFGGSSLAATIVLTTYMGGMAAGGAIGGILVRKSLRPHLWYGWTEFLIGIYAVITPFLFDWVMQIYVGISAGYAPDSPQLVVLRFALGVSVLLVPTLMMGATLPFMFKYLNDSGFKSNQAIASLYAHNIFGAALGALLGAYLILPSFGKSRSILLAAIISLGVAFFIFNAAKKGVFQPLVAMDRQPIQMHELVGRGSPRQAMIYLLLLFFSGVMTLGIESLSMHMLAAVAGNSIYAFGLMLSVFLAALGVGGYVNFLLIERNIKGEKIVLFSYLGVLASLMVSGLLWDRLSGYFASFEPALSVVNYGFYAREIIRALVCVVAIFPVAFFIGLIYPTIFAKFVENHSRQDNASAAGVANAINTIGGIAGVLLVNMLLISIVGSALTFKLIYFAVILIGLIYIFLIYTKHLNKFLAATACLGGMGLMGLTMPSNWNLDMITNGANVYFRSYQWGKTVDHLESAEGGFTTVARKGNNLTLLTNGKFQGNNTGEVQAQESFALLPLKYLHNFDRALVIGYGTGTSAQVVHKNGFKQLDIAELSPDIVQMANRHYGAFNGRVSAQPGVTLYYTDGRNMLMVVPKTYDLISMEITSIWFAGAANLYNKEFYQIAKSKLAPHGVLQQWLQFHHMSTKDFMTIILTARSVFKDVDVYFVGGQGILIAGDNLSYRQQNNHLKGFDGRSVNLQGTAYAPVLSADDLSRFYKKLNPLQLKYFISTDDNLYLEYNTPKGNALEYDTVAANLDYLKNLKKAEDTIPH